MARYALLNCIRHNFVLHSITDGADTKAVVIILALRTGVRQGEILGLRWDDVDLKRGQIQVNQGNWRGHIDKPKGARSRSYGELRGQGIMQVTGIAAFTSFPDDTPGTYDQEAHLT